MTKAALNRDDYAALHRTDDGEGVFELQGIAQRHIGGTGRFCRPSSPRTNSRIYVIEKAGERRSCRRNPCDLSRRDDFPAETSLSAVRSSCPGSPPGYGEDSRTLDHDCTIIVTAV